jgi:enoyl-CoA hydratase/carnithine racemase
VTNSTPLNVDKSNKQCWRVTVDNPPINLMTPELLIGWHQLVGQMEVDPNLHVVVFDSANPDFFVNHLDSSRFADLPTTPGPTGLPMVLDFFIRLSLAPVVTIALIRGRARGGGWSSRWRAT